MKGKIYIKVIFSLILLLATWFSDELGLSIEPWIIYSLRALILIAAVTNLYFTINSNRKNENSKGTTIKDFLRKEFGETIGNYIYFEFQLYLGVFKYLVSPVKTTKEILKSYFATESLGGLIFIILFFLVCEPLLLHILIYNSVPEDYRSAVHIVLLLSEIYLLQMVIGNLYHLKNSKVIVTDESLKANLGILSKLNISFDQIKSISLPQETKNEYETSKLGFGDPTLRIVAKKDFEIQVMFKIKKVKCIDLCLTRQHVQLLESSFTKASS